jgi:hypothetical protein
MAHSDVTMERFLDADKEPTQTLLPIEGYEKKPLVSLEEAVIPVKTLIHNLDTMVWTAKRNSSKPPDGLTTDESAAIHLYTMQWPTPHFSLYVLLNQMLRSEMRDNLKPWFSYLKLFFTALYKLPSIKKTIWRGIRGNVSDQYDNDHIWWGISSCTETMQVMERFIGRSGMRTLFMIECLNGKAIRPHSFYKTENEIVIMPGTYLRVVDKWSPSEGLYMIHLQEVTPPCQFLAPPFDSTSSSIDITLQLLNNSLPTSQEPCT